jgi:hypothetical protein
MTDRNRGIMHQEMTTMNARSCMQCAVVVAIGSILFSAPAVHAQQAWIGLYHDQTATNCHLDSSDAGTHFAYVVLTKTFDFSLISIKATVPAGVTWVADILPSTMKMGSSGNSQTGCWLVPTGPCIGGPNLVILAIEYSAPSALPPTSWEINGASTPNIGFFDCGSGFFGGMSIVSWINNPGANCSHFQYLAPYFPSPPNDGVNMPTNIKLGFHGDANHIWLSTEPFTTPRDADIVCAAVGGGSCPNPFDPGLLAPNTKYYWMAGNVCDPPSEDCRDALSDVWTFTTGGGPLAVSPSTWGAVKAFYR